MHGKSYKAKENLKEPSNNRANQIHGKHGSKFWKSIKTIETSVKTIEKWMKTIEKSLKTIKKPVKVIKKSLQTIQRSMKTIQKSRKILETSELTSKIDGKQLNREIRADPR